MRNNATLLLSFLLVSTGVASAQADQEMNAKAIATDVEKRIEACPRREVVAAFDRKFHKQVWVKEAWGPPTQVFADVKSNDSLLYPYVLIVEFHLGFFVGPERKNKNEADHDANLSPMPGIRGGKYRNTFFVNRDGLHLKLAEFLGTDPVGVPKGWEERSPWSDACWDQIH